MQAMLAYIDWMRRDANPRQGAGRGIGKIDHIKPIRSTVNASTARSAPPVMVRRAKVSAAATSGSTLPLWGEESFNIGAGMARTYTAAAFVKRNMPIALHDRFPLGQGGLSDQDAVDVAEFFTHQPRPDFAPSQGLATGQEAGRCTLLKRGERCGAPSEPLVGLLQVAAQLAEAMIGPVAAADLVAAHEDDLAFQVGCRSGPRAGCHRAGRWCRGWA
jgi:hypothetical protein